MRDLFEEIDVVVCPSRADCFPIVVMEGLMYEKTIVISDRTGFNGVLKDQKEALYFKNEDDEELAHLMQMLIADREMRMKIGKSGRAVYEKNYTMEHFSDRLIECIYGAESDM